MRICRWSIGALLFDRSARSKPKQLEMALKQCLHVASAILHHMTDIADLFSKRKTRLLVVGFQRVLILKLNSTFRYWSTNLAWRFLTEAETPTYSIAIWVTETYKSPPPPPHTHHVRKCAIGKEVRVGMFYLTTHSTHFIYGCMTSECLTRANLSLVALSGLWKHTRLLTKRRIDMAGMMVAMCF